MARWATTNAKERYLNSRYFKALCDFERKLIREAMETSAGDINAAAQLLEVDEEMLKVRITKLGGVLDGMPIPPQYTGRWVPRTPSERESVRSGQESARTTRRKAKGQLPATADEAVDIDKKGSGRRCSIYDAPCINPSYCDAAKACCAGDPECKPKSATSSEDVDTQRNTDDA